MRATLGASLAVGLAAPVLLAGCGRKDGPVTQAAKKDGAAGVSAHGIEEVKAIAEAGFIYGLPLVMNYAVQYDFTVDKASSQFKAQPQRHREDSRGYAETATRLSGEQPTPAGLSSIRGSLRLPGSVMKKNLGSRHPADFAAEAVWFGPAYGVD